MGTRNFTEILKTGETRECLIENLIIQNELAILYAPTNQYKTFLSLKIALEVLTGSQELGATKTGSVYIFSPDTAQSDLMLRIRGLLKASYSHLEEDFLKNLDLNFDGDLDLTSKGWGIEDDYEIIKTENDYGHTRTDKRYFERPKKWSEQEFDFRQDGSNNNLEGTLLIIDTLSQAIGSSSINDDIAIRKSIRACKQIIKNSSYPISILLIAHAGKDSSKGIMGSSLQKNDIPTVLKVRKRKNGQMELFREKMKSSAEGKSIPFKMREIVVDDEETLYVDIGSELNELENEIIKRFLAKESKDNIRDNTYELLRQQYNSKKSFNVVFARAWKSLSVKGFLKKDNRTTS
tara:strand:+ start:547 stop:1593 length:1047 start_codon:yes stop_codon:yes gene_type:complete